MKTKHSFLFTAAIISGIALSRAQDTSPGLAANIAGYAQDTNVVWGVATNGIRAGLKIILPDSGYSYIHIPKCIMYFQNVGTNTNNVIFRVRYKAELRGPDGNPIELNPGQEIPVHNQRKISSPRPRETDQIDFFSIPEVFQVRSNGIHQLIISVQAATNRWHGKLTYFDMPPVTNTFEISTNLIIKL
jgi:hypothetical protein